MWFRHRVVSEPVSPLLAARLHRLDVGGAQCFSADGPFSACNLVDADPSDAAHCLAFDFHHRIRDLVDHRLLLAFVENTFNEMNINEGHDTFLSCSLLLGKIPVRRPEHAHDRGCFAPVQELNLPSTEIVLARPRVAAYSLFRCCNDG